jgi:hypothetical protein
MRRGGLRPRLESHCSQRDSHTQYAIGGSIASNRALEKKQMTTSVDHDAMERSGEER